MKYLPIPINDMLPGSKVHSILFPMSSCISCSIAQSCPTLWSNGLQHAGFPVFPHLAVSSNSCPLSHPAIQPSSHLILCCSLLLLPTIFPNITVVSNELTLCIRWLKYWSFSISTSPFNEYSGLISFRIDWFALLTVQKALIKQSVWHTVNV